MRLTRRLGGSRLAVCLSPGTRIARVQPVRRQPVRVALPVTLAGRIACGIAGAAIAGAAIAGAVADSLSRAGPEPVPLRR